MHTHTVKKACKESGIVPGTEYPMKSDTLESRSNWKCTFTDLRNLLYFGYLNSYYTTNLVTWSL